MTNEEIMQMPMIERLAFVVFTLVILAGLLWLLVSVGAWLDGR